MRLCVSLLNSESSPFSVIISVTDHDNSGLVALLGSLFIQEGNAAVEISDKYVKLLPEEQLLFLSHSGRRSDLNLCSFASVFESH